MYLNYFGLTEYPFSMTPDPHFLFFTKHHQEALNHLLYGIETKKGFIELTGEVGSGKTTLCRAVLNKVSADVKTALLLNPNLTETQLLKAILLDFGLPIKGRSRLDYVNTLNTFLLNQLDKDNKVALIIDEAQDLSPGVLEQIRLLSNLETDQHKLIQIVMCGQPEFKDRLASPNLRQLRQRIIVRYHLPPLSETETSEYINYRLRIAGYKKQNNLFDFHAIGRIYKYTKGIPRLINSLCDMCLLGAYANKAPRVDTKQVKTAIAQLEGTL
jgi:general secretion pathway protein A